jgi:glyoxylase-like metal-dependent hydrolase (beta-lactamase superfamily II)
MLGVECLVTGKLEENCYILNIGDKALIVDPGDDEEKILSIIKDDNYDVLGILITHSHFDHVGALKRMTFEFPNAKVIDNKCSGDISIEPFNFKIIETPGHTEDSVSFYFDNYDVILTGDFIFKGTIGNFPEDAEDEMIKSLKVFKYIPKDVTVYPGHGPETTVGDELESNPFL